MLLTSNFVGHTSVKTTQGYIKVDKKKARNIVGRVVRLAKAASPAKP